MPSEIPFIRPSFPEPAELAEDFSEIVQANWYTNFGPKERQFARALAEYLGPDLHVATVANGTLALIAALHAAVGQGVRDRYVLMPSFTFIAVAQAALWTGYRPWFIDIDTNTWQPSIPSALAILESSRDRVAGIVLPNVFGVGNPDIETWEDLASEWELPLVIDSAAGFGSMYEDGERVGGRGSCEIFSLHATKPFAVGEGGAIASRDPRLVQRAYQFQNFGFGEARECIHLGMNGKLQEFNAAIGLRQLVELDCRLASRRKVFECYRAELTSFNIRFQVNAEASSLTCGNACCTSADHKVAVLASLRKHVIQARDYYNPPLHLHPYFLANAQLIGIADLSVTEEICSRIVSLPVHDDMAPDDVARVVAAVKEGSSR
ncbi:DegT/DnrJ/EryC1/StrS family aminotransferase [Mycobacterium intracellulare]|uniref:DegT/DnrJ/EryC1/StrS family aminotransferase n=1 Tax=Mycobacterium intracellulare TaxID=1767 RepID=UPI0009F59255|nr:DegT/DnrJ/EryC1/StrS family aminotransferase [Mycobacterium intracellulare]